MKKIPEDLSKVIKKRNRIKKLSKYKLYKLYLDSRYVAKSLFGLQCSGENSDCDGTYERYHYKLGAIRMYRGSAFKRSTSAPSDCTNSVPLEKFEIRFIFQKWRWELNTFWKDQYE